MDLVEKITDKMETVGEGYKAAGDRAAEYFLD